MSSSSASLPIPEGPLSVSGAPNLPADFTDTFTFSNKLLNTNLIKLCAK